MSISGFFPRVDVLEREKLNTALGAYRREIQLNDLAILFDRANG